MNFHSLKKGQIAVVQAERNNGIVLAPSGQWHLGLGEAFRVFESIAEARAFAHDLVNTRPEVECGLYDCTGAHLEHIVNTP